MGKHVNYSGLVVAGIGFFLTRFTVTLAIYDDPTQFYLAGVVPLVLGLGLAAFGMALAVANVNADVARTTALWCVIGAGTMLVLVVLTLLGSTTSGMPEFATIRSRTYLSNFLIGGSVGGTLTGLYAARSRGQRDTLRQQANRLQVLNRLLRHEVLNSVSVIQGYATLDGDRDARSMIEKHSEAIVRTIEEVKYLTASTDTTEPTRPIDVGACLEASVETVTGRHPDARISVEPHPESLRVWATERLEQVFVPLIENAVVHASSDRPRVDVSVSATAGRVRVSVRDEGPGLPESQRALLESGDIDEFDNPGKGFSLNVVRLIVESYDGSIDTDVGPDGTTITVALPRATADAGPEPIPMATTGVRPAIPHLVVTLGAAVVAGVLFGISSNLLGGSIGIIGVLYGVEDPVVGWITHEFHSIVFGFVFAGLLSLAPAAYRNRLPFCVALAAAWGLVLWFVAAGFISSIWLRLVGIPSPIPSLSPVSFVSHLVWGISLGALTAWGYEHVTPWLARFGR